jgi:hypothetical protein
MIIRQGSVENGGNNGIFNRRDRAMHSHRGPDQDNGDVVMRLFIILTVIALGGCRDYEKTYSQDGYREYRIKCNYPECDIEAGRLCKKRGYEISGHRDPNGSVIVTCNR